MRAPIRAIRIDESNADGRVEGRCWLDEGGTQVDDLTAKKARVDPRPATNVRLLGTHVPPGFAVRRRGFLLTYRRFRTHRGLEIGLHLRPGLTEENFIAEAIGNLAAYRLQQARGEALAWQVVRVEGSSGHHFRLVIRHPERVLDIGIEPALKRLLDSLSDETVEELRKRFEAAEREGLKPTRIRHVHESVDFWRDDFWNWLG